MRQLAKPVLFALLILTFLWLANRDDDQELDPSTAPSASASRAPDEAAASASPSAPPVSSPSPTRSTSPPEQSVLDGSSDNGEVVDSSAPAVPRDQVQASEFAEYEATAVGFMSAFARPRAGTSAEAWWAGVVPYLTDEAARDYEGVDPRNVPFTHVGERATVVPTGAPTALLAAARVETDAGPYLVEMTSGPDGVRVMRAIPELAYQ